MNPTEEEMEKALSLLSDLLNILGWKVREPDTTPQEGLIIGTPEFLAAYDESLEMKKEELQ